MFSISGANSDVSKSYFHNKSRGSLETDTKAFPQRSCHDVNCAGMLRHEFIRDIWMHLKIRILQNGGFGFSVSMKGRGNTPTICLLWDPQPIPLPIFF